MPSKADIPKLKQRALDAGVLHELVSSVVPFDNWSADFYKYVACDA